MDYMAYINAGGYTLHWNRYGYLLVNMETGALR